MLLKHTEHLSTKELSQSFHGNFLDKPLQLCAPKSTYQIIRTGGRIQYTLLCMAETYTLSSYGYIFDGIIVLKDKKKQNISINCSISSWCIIQYYLSVLPLCYSFFFYIQHIAFLFQCSN